MISLVVQRKVEREDVTESYFYEAINCTFAEADWTCTTIIVANMVRGMQTLFTGEVIWVDVQHGTEEFNYTGRVQRQDAELQELGNLIERRA